MFPAYLLNDWGFWLFTVVYVLTVLCAVRLLLLLPAHSTSRPNIVRAMPLWVVILFTLLLIEQFFHQAEHVTQMYQFQMLGMPPTEAHGFVWFLDDEWNHFTFNTVYYIGACVVFAMVYRAMRRAKIRLAWPHTLWMNAFLIIEGWHIVEHTYRIIQHVQGLCDQCPGILDPFTGINRLVIHFWLNFIALTLPAAVFVWFGFPKLLVRKSKQRRITTASTAAA